MSAPLVAFRLFVYGSLKRGQANHAPFCARFVSAATATVWGRLYLKPSGYPMLVVPEADVLAVGSSDPMADAALLVRLSSPPPNAKGALEGDWEPIQGELFTFDDPQDRLPRLDALEDFRPGEDCLYHRAIVPVHHTRTELAWTFIAPAGRLPPGSTRMGPSWPS